MSLSTDDRERVRQAIDIVDLVGGYLPLRREGRHFKCLCPWHDDSRPSLFVNQERQSYKCFVCNLGGDIFSFTMKMEGLEFPEALEFLAEKAGLTLERRRSGPSSDDKKTLLQIMAWAEQRYHDCLLKSSSAQIGRDYFEGRGITPESIDRFKLGFAPEEWDWLLTQSRDTRFSSAQLERVGLVRARQGGGGHYDWFRNRMLFSIRDSQGRPVGLGGRVLPGPDADKTAKYINSPETPLFSKSQLLYGLDLARESITKSRTALVMEGYTDVVVAHQCGFQNAVAVLGTALGESHVRLLKRFADRIVLVLDGDEAGRKRANEILDLFMGEQIDLRVLTLPGELDPCDFLLQQGAPAFQEQIERAIDAVEHKFNVVAAGLSGRGTHEVQAALEDLLTTLAKSPHASGEVGSAAMLKQEHILQRASHRFGVSEAQLRARLGSLRHGKPARPARVVAEAPTVEAAVAFGDIDEWERELMELLLVAPQTLPEVLHEVRPEQFAVGPLRELFSRACVLVASGRSFSFAELMIQIEEPELKSVLVDLDEHAQKKSHADAAKLVRQVLESYRLRHEGRHMRQQVHELREGRIDEERGLQLLRQRIESGRSRQGISAPTDG
ncbi:MAG: DNA primase [Planctomycetia bacterium]|nr:DNA primase [Planctomycetia bacterium]